AAKLTPALLFRNPLVERFAGLGGERSTRVWITQRLRRARTDAREHVAHAGMRRQQDVAGQLGEPAEALTERGDDARVLRLVGIAIHIVRDRGDAVGVDEMQAAAAFAGIPGPRRAPRRAARRPRRPESE